MSDPRSEERAPTPAEQRAARNEALWREVNNRIDEVDRQMRVLADDTRLQFRCECGRPDCDETISMLPGEYEEARSQNDTFAVALGHEQPTIEHVVKRTDRYLIVDKLAAVEPIVGADGKPDSGA